MKGRTLLAWLSLLVIALSAGCGKEASGPTGPSAARSFLEGTWTGTLLSVGNAETRTIDADFSGVDCSTLTNSTFTGHVTLTKMG